MTLNYIAIGVILCIPWIITFIIVSGSEGGKLWKLRKWIRHARAVEVRCYSCDSGVLYSQMMEIGRYRVSCGCGMAWPSQDPYGPLLKGAAPYSERPTIAVAQMPDEVWLSSQHDPERVFSWQLLPQPCEPDAPGAVRYVKG
jgi:hypothetical protein